MEAVLQLVMSANRLPIGRLICLICLASFEKRNLLGIHKKK